MSGPALLVPPTAQTGLGLRNSVASPTTAETMPPMSIQTALSVGDPVKNRETSELNELVALTPMMMSTTPPASSAREMILFIMDFRTGLLTLFAKTDLASWVDDSSCSPTPGKEPEHYYDQRNHQEEMDYPSHRVTGYETEQPQND